MKKWIQDNLIIWWLPLVALVGFGLIYAWSSWDYQQYLKMEEEAVEVTAVISEIEEKPNDFGTYDYDYYCDYEFNGVTYERVYLMERPRGNYASIGSQVAVLVHPDAPDDVYISGTPTDPSVFATMGVVFVLISVGIAFMPMLGQAREKNVI